MWAGQDDRDRGMDWDLANGSSESIALNHTKSACNGKWAWKDLSAILISALERVFRRPSSVGRAAVS
jgi:hypothetical protein